MNKVFRKRILFFLFTTSIVLFIVNCMNSQTIIYSYSDGSGNTYTIKENTLEYKPVKPAFSSSGTYNGGEYAKKKISKSEYNNIVSLIDSAISDKSIHIENRMKTSGFIKVQKNDKITTVIIRPNSEKQLRIEELLKTILLK